MSSFNVSSLLKGRGPQRQVAEPEPKKQILFVCTGNIARSASAKYLARQLSSESSEWTFESAGTGAVLGSPVARFIDDELAARGIDFSDHSGQQVNDRLVKESELILVMEKEHLEWMVREWPQHRNKIHLLKQMARMRSSAGRRSDPVSYMKQADAEPLPEDNIADPFGKAPELSTKAVEEVEEALTVVVPWLGN